MEEENSTSVPYVKSADPSKTKPKETFVTQNTVDFENTKVQ